MDQLHLSRLLIAIFVIHVHVVSGQIAISPTSITEERGSTTQLVCSFDGTDRTFTWRDVIRNVFIFVGSDKTPDARYDNFAISDPVVAPTSTLTISDIQVEDEGQYECSSGVNASPLATITVEVRSALSVTVGPLREGIEATAQCDAVGGRPQENLTWYIDNVEETTDVVVTNPTNPTDGLSNTRSVLTFTPTAANNGQTLSCRITGHTVSDLNQRDDTTLDVQLRAPPADGSITLTVDDQDGSLLVTCAVNPAVTPQPHPEITDFIIYQDGTIISRSSTARVTQDPETCLNFTCTAGNGLGNTTATALPQCPSPTPGPSIGAIAGGVGGVVVLCIICILVWYFCCKRGDCGGACTCCPDLEWCPDGNCCPCCDSDDPPKPVGGGSGGGKDNRVSGVATYNTSDPEKAPVAKPRSTIQHDTNNPGGDMYAMVDKGGRGDRDYPDAGRNGRGQPKSQTKGATNSGYQVP